AHKPRSNVGYFSPVRPEVQACRQRQIAETAGAGDDSNPHVEVAPFGQRFIPIAVAREAIAPMHYAASGNAIQFPLHEFFALRGVGRQIEIARQQGAAWFAPNRTAVSPFGAASFKAVRKQRKVIRQPDVVMTKERNVVATHLAERKIAISIAEAGPFREVQPPDTRIVKFRNNGSCVIGTTVTNNE